MVLSVFSVTVAFAGTSAAAGHTMSGIDLASDIPGPIEFRNTQTGTYQVVVAFDRNVTDAGNITFEIEGTTPDGNTLNVQRAATGGQVQLRNGSTANDAPDERNLQNSVAIITVGNAPNPDNNIVTDATLTVNYSAGGASFTKEFDLIATSASIDAGAPGEHTVYQGEQIAIYNLTRGHDEYEFFLDDNFQKSGRSGQNTTVALENTEDLNANVKYDIEFHNSTAPRRIVTANTTLRIRTLGLSITTDQRSVIISSNESGIINATVRSNIAGRFVRVQLINRNAGNAEVQTRFINLRSGGADREAQIEFSNVSQGPNSRLVLRATDVETGITATSEVIRVFTGPQKFAYQLTLSKNTTHAIAFPGPINGTYGDVFGHINGTIWMYDAFNDTWRQPGPNEGIDPLDAVYVTTEERATITIDFADSDSGPRAPGEKRVAAGWNFLGAPQYSGAESAFVATTAEPKRILHVARQPGDQPFAPGDEFGWYAFGQDSPDPRVSAFTGYWVFMADNGTVGANVYRGVSFEDIGDLLTGGEG